VRVAHERSWQSCAAAGVLLAALVGCASQEPAPSIWPPSDFRCEMEELALRDGTLQVVRRVRFDGSGLVVYGTSTRSLVDPETKVALPVFDRVAVYQLVPACVRGLARRLKEKGVDTIDVVQGQRGAAEDTGLSLRWRAFGTERLLTVRGRVNGPMLQILGVVAAHLPPGERFSFAGDEEHPVVSVLRGVPEPIADTVGALRAHEALLAQHGDNGAWLLDAFALACAAGLRESAAALLERWGQREALRQAVSTFPDEGLLGLTTEGLRRLLPPQAPS